jgi:hypothetical protein
LPTHALRVYNVVTFSPTLQELGDNFRRILQIRIDDDNCIAARVVDSRRERDLLSKVPTQVDNGYPPILGTKCTHDTERMVLAAVVNVNDLASNADLVEHRAEAAMEFGENVLLIECRHNDRHEILAEHGFNFHHVRP